MATCRHWLYAHKGRVSSRYVYEKWVVWYIQSMATYRHWLYAHKGRVSSRYVYEKWIVRYIQSMATCRHWLYAHKGRVSSRYVYEKWIVWYIQSMATCRHCLYAHKGRVSLLYVTYVTITTSLFDLCFSSYIKPVIGQVSKQCFIVQDRQRTFKLHRMLSVNSTFMYCRDTTSTYHIIFKL